MTCMHSHFALAIVVLGLSLAADLLPHPAAAGFESNDALFLAPSQVPEALYTDHQLSVATTVTNAPTYTYTPSVVGGTILGVQILPLLVPNPASANGAYSPAALAGINISNYSSYFFAQPNVDYFANLTSGSAQVDYMLPGTYFVDVTATDNGGKTTFSKIFEDDVNDLQGSIGSSPARDPAGAGRIVASPNADLNIVSNTASEPSGTNGYSSAAFQTLTAEGKNPVLANNVQSVINSIQAACRAKGGPISVAVVGHGVPGAIQIGNTRITNTPRAGTNDITPAQFQAAIDKIAAGPNAGAQCVKSIDFYSCNTGRNLPGNPAGTTFLNALQASIPSARAFNQYTTAFAPVIVYNRFTGRFTQVPGRFDVGAGGALGSFAVPEASSMLLLGTAFGAVLLVCRCRRPIGGREKAASA
jgi:hypothetical protein